MLVLSMCQPWAWAIARGHKVVENHGAGTCYRGDIAIHASLRVDLESAESPLIRAVGWDPADPAATIGGIIAVVRISGICAAALSGRPCDCGPWAAPGAYHWLLADPRPLQRPVMALGQPGLWALGAEQAAEVMQLAAPPGRPDPIWPGTEIGTTAAIQVQPA
jgi:hypothetical protein